MRYFNKKREINLPLFFPIWRKNNYFFLAGFLAVLAAGFFAVLVAFFVVAMRILRE
jgi:hypothetical protein